MTLSPERAGSEDAAKEAALRILAHGARTEREIERRLLERGYLSEAVGRAVERLRRVSLLDDRAFARSFLRTELMRSPQGRRLLEMKLRRRGVPDSIVQELDALAQADPDLVGRSLASEAERAAAALAQFRRRCAHQEPEVVRRRLTQGLARRGFAWEMIRDLLGEGSRDS